MAEPEIVYELMPGKYAGPGRAWVHPQGGGMGIVVTEPDGELLDAADLAVDAALVFTADSGWHLQPPPALEVAVMAGGGCTAREHAPDGAVLVCKRPEANHRGRHKWRPLPVEDVDLPAGPEPQEIDVPVVDRATGEPVVLGVVQPEPVRDMPAEHSFAATMSPDGCGCGCSRTECQAGHEHSSPGNAAACDAREPLQPPVQRDEQIYRSFVRQGYSPEFAHRKASERWEWR